MHYLWLFVFTIALLQMMTHCKMLLISLYYRVLFEILLIKHVSSYCCDIAKRQGKPLIQ